MTRRQPIPLAPDGADAPTPTAEDLTRRIFVQRLAFAAGGAVVIGSSCKKDEPKKPEPPKRPEVPVVSRRTFTNEEWRVLVAAVDRVLPKDEDAGGVEAGVPEYIDRMLQTEQMARMKRDFPGGLAALNRRAQRMFKVDFPDAAAAQQDELLAIFKDSSEGSGESRWYEMLIVLCLEGYLGDPSYGGNQAQGGWAAMGFTLVGSNIKGDPSKDYDGSRTLRDLRCGTKKGC